MTEMFLYSAIDAYGEDGKHGVIEVTTNKNLHESVVEEVSSIINKPSVKISTSAVQVIGYRETDNEDKEPVVMKIQNYKMTSLEGADENVLLFVDGKRIARSSLAQIDPNNIQSLTVLKGENAIERYGEEGKDGVIEITTKGKN